MKKRWLALVCALGLLTGSALAAGQTYPDVPEWEWYAQAVADVTDRGLMLGVEEGLFAPLAEVTRATVVTVLWRMEGSPAPQSRWSFPDVDPDAIEDWFALPAAWAREVGIAAGYEDGGFHGNDPVTREQLAVFLWQYARYKGEPVAQGSLGYFDDAYRVSDWAETAVRHAVGMGLLRGSDLGLLDPGGTASRAQLASILQRMLIPVSG